MKTLSWDDYYMSLVYLSAMKSKDRFTHIGAVIVGPDREIRSVGYNGLPRKVNDNVEAREERPEKYFWYEHAERNAIYNANLIGTTLKGCIMYTNGTPCSDCGRAVIQSGIKEVVIDLNWENAKHTGWSESCDRTKEMFKEANVILRGIDYNELKIVKYRRGEII